MRSVNEAPRKPTAAELLRETMKEMGVDDEAMPWMRRPDLAQVAATMLLRDQLERLVDAVESLDSTLQARGT